MPRHQTVEDVVVEEPACELLFPEILSVARIAELLKERNVELKGLEHMEKADLIELCYKSLVPQPQRKCRANRRGRVMAKQQILLAKRKRTHDEMSGQTHTNMSNQASSTMNGNSRFISSYNIPGGSGDRLKPPPSTVNFERKTIKLGAGKSTTQPGPESSCKVETVPSAGVASTVKNPTKATGGKISLNRTSMSSKPDIVIKEFKPVTTEKKMDSPATATKVLPKTEPVVKPARKIKINRLSGSNIEIPVGCSSEDSTPSPMVEDEKSASVKEEEDSEGVVTKKFKRISVKFP